MVALVKSNSEVQAQQPQHDRFLAMLPQIRRQASAAFRSQRCEAREELIQEVIANSYRTWVLLARRGKESVAYATPLAQYAIRQVRDGRRVGGHQSAQDIIVCQRQQVTRIQDRPVRSARSSERSLECTAGGGSPGWPGRGCGGATSTREINVAIVLQKTMYITIP